MIPDPRDAEEIETQQLPVFVFTGRRLDTVSMGECFSYESLTKQRDPRNQEAKNAEWSRLPT